MIRIAALCCQGLARTFATALPVAVHHDHDATCSVCVQRRHQRFGNPEQFDVTWASVWKVNRNARSEKLVCYGPGVSFAKLLDFAGASLVGLAKR